MGSEMAARTGIGCEGGLGWSTQNRGGEKLDPLIQTIEHAHKNP